MPEVSTASLPDIIFMLLFFFMTVTVLRNTATAKIPVLLPATTSPSEVDYKSDDYTIYVGYHKDDLIQLNDRLLTIDQLNTALTEIAKGLFEHEKLKVPIYMRVDKEVEMSLVYKIKLLLRKAGLRKIYYMTTKQAVDNINQEK